MRIFNLKSIFILNFSNEYIIIITLILSDTNTVTSTIATDLYPIISNGKVNTGVAIVFKSANNFKNLNFSCAIAYDVNVLRGNVSAILSTIINISNFALFSSDFVSDAENIASTLITIIIPIINATIQIIIYKSKNIPFILESSSPLA